MRAAPEVGDDTNLDVKMNRLIRVIAGLLPPTTTSSPHAIMEAGPCRIHSGFRRTAGRDASEIQSLEGWERAIVERSGEGGAARVGGPMSHPSHATVVIV